MKWRKIYGKLVYRLAKYHFLKNFVISQLGLMKGGLVSSTLFRLYRPQCFLEIGVGKGENLRRFIFESQCLGFSAIKYFGFDSFDEGPPSEETDLLQNRIKRAQQGSKFWDMHYSTMESIYAIGEDYDKVDCQIKLFKGNTKETLPENLSQVPSVDFVYIDGGHSYETVKSDYLNVKTILKTGTVVVFDDFNCERGVSRFIGELLSEEGGFFSRVMFIPADFGTWHCSTVVLIYNEEEAVQR